MTFTQILLGTLANKSWNERGMEGETGGGERGGTEKLKLSAPKSSRLGAVSEVSLFKGLITDFLPEAPSGGR